MSTQSISQITLNKTQRDLDLTFKCVSEKIILSKRFGFKNEHSTEDSFKLNYISELINNDRNCYLIFNDDCTLEKVNKFINKFK